VNTLAIVLATVLALPNGALPRHIRQLGGTHWLAHVAAWSESAARAEELPPAYLLALLIAESGLNPNAVSSVGAFGLGQIHPRTPLGRELRAACRLSADADECAEMGVRVAARALRYALRASHGNRLAAVVRYRHGHIAPARASDRHVIGLAQTIAWRMRKQVRAVPRAKGVADAR
jgi:soluble lytic murein transglycosylase-like protein